MESNKSPKPMTIKLSNGYLTGEQIEFVFNALPLEVTFVDENDIIRYFSRPPNSLFTRKSEIIGTKVQDCHSEKSIAMVNSLLDDFKSGERDSAGLWFEEEGKFIMVIYTALRDENGNYLGCLETAQDITGIKELEGSKRELD